LEGYALHWLEDSYAAGHVVGSWGDAAWRKGTHDYYNEFGFDTVAWDGKSVVMYGDANLKPADLERASAHVARSLRELAKALTAGDPLAESARGFGPGIDAIYAFDSCQELVQPADQGYQRIGVEFWRGFGTLPVAGRGEGDVHPPRFRDELGPFLGGFASLG